MLHNRPTLKVGFWTLFHVEFPRSLVLSTAWTPNINQATWLESQTLKAYIVEIQSFNVLKVVNQIWYLNCLICFLLWSVKYFDQPKNLNIWKNILSHHSGLYLPPPWKVWCKRPRLNNDGSLRYWFCIKFCLKSDKKWNPNMLGVQA